MIPLVTDLFDVLFTSQHNSLVQVSAMLPWVTAMFCPAWICADQWQFTYMIVLYAQELGASPELHKLSQNVFEAFSRSPQATSPYHLH